MASFAPKPLAKRLFAEDGSSSSPASAAPITSRSANVRRLVLRLWAWKVHNFINKEHEVASSRFAKLGATATFTNYSDDLAAELLAVKGTYPSKLFHAVFGAESLESLKWDTTILKLRAFEESEGLPEVRPFVDDYSPTTAVATITAPSQPAVAIDVTVSAQTDPKAQAADILMTKQLPATDLDSMIASIQHEIVPLAQSDVRLRRDKLSKLQQLLLAMQDISLHYDDTQCSLLRKTVQANAKATGGTPGAPRSASAATPYTPRGYAAPATGTPKPPSRSQAMFYRQMVDERRKLDDLQIQIDRIKSTMEEDGAGDRGETVESLVPQFGGGRRKSIKVRSVLESSTKPPSGAAMKRPSVAMMFETIDTPVEDEKSILFSKSEHDKAVLIEENKRLRDMIIASNPSGADTESRTIVNELKAWEVERDDLEVKIDHLEDVVNSLRERIHNLELKPRAKA